MGGRSENLHGIERRNPACPQTPDQWTGDGYLSKEQYQRLEQDTVSDLRITNIFLRLVLFFFTMIGVAAAVALFFTIFLSRPSQQTTGIFLLIFAAVSYTAAEVAVTQARLYRYGIEEALAVCSVALLCAGLGRFFQRHSTPRAKFSLWFPPLAPLLRSGSGTASICGTHFPPR